MGQTNVFFLVEVGRGLVGLRKKGERKQKKGCAKKQKKSIRQRGLGFNSFQSSTDEFFPISN